MTRYLGLIIHMFRTIAPNFPTKNFKHKFLLCYTYFLTVSHVYLLTLVIINRIIAYLGCSYVQSVGGPLEGFPNYECIFPSITSADYVNVIELILQIPFYFFSLVILLIPLIGILLLSACLTAIAISLPLRTFRIGRALVQKKTPSIHDAISAISFSGMLLALIASNVFSPLAIWVALQPEIQTHGVRESGYPKWSNGHQIIKITRHETDPLYIITDSKKIKCSLWPEIQTEVINEPKYEIHDVSFRGKLQLIELDQHELVYAVNICQSVNNTYYLQSKYGNKPSLIK